MSKLLFIKKWNQEKFNNDYICCKLLNYILNSLLSYNMTKYKKKYNIIMYGKTRENYVSAS
jgi:hypothetical protein